MASPPPPPGAPPPMPTGAPPGSPHPMHPGGNGITLSLMNQTAMQKGFAVNYEASQTGPPHAPTWSVRCLRTYTSRRYLRSLTSAFQSMGPCMALAPDYRRKRPKSLLRRRLGSDWAGAVSCIDFGSVPRTPDAHCRQQLSVPVVRVLHSDHLCLQVSGPSHNALICSACILIARHVS